MRRRDDVEARLALRRAEIEDELAASCRALLRDARAAVARGAARHPFVHVGAALAVGAGIARFARRGTPRPIAAPEAAAEASGATRAGAIRWLVRAFRGVRFVSAAVDR